MIRAAATVVLVAVASCGRLGFDLLGGTGDGGGDGGPPALSCFRDVSAGRSSSCAIDARGDVWCWGDNTHGEADPVIGSTKHTLIPAHVVLDGPALDVKVGKASTCARLEDGRVECWGRNEVGELGDGSMTDGGPVEVALGAERAKELAVSSRTACIVRASDGGVWCWGGAANGILATMSPIPTPIPELVGMHGLQLGHRHACGIDAAGAVECWGHAADGKIGPPFSDRITPSTVASFGPAIALGTGGKLTCAIDATGAVRCIGDNQYGGLGDGTFVTRSAPGAAALADGVEVGAGSHGACARRTDGSVACWGDGSDGFLGGGQLDTRSSAGDVGTRVSKLSVGYHHACGLTADQIVCWGRDAEAELGRGSRAIATTPQIWGTAGSPVAGFLSMGLQHGCAVASGSAVCWGRNSDEELGDGSRLSRATPSSPSLSFTPVGIAAGAVTTCAFSATTTACWGRGSSGQLGDGMIHTTPSAPVTVVGLAGVVGMSVGGDHTCAIGPGLACWGSDASGQLGLTTNTPQSSPVVVAGAMNPMRVAAGGKHTCVIHNPAAIPELACWGSNSHGQLGDGSTTDRDVIGAPVALPGTPVEVAAGLEHTCAILSTGSVYCWGRDDGGESGQGTGADERLPVLVTLPGIATSITANTRGSCASLVTGHVFCWGTGDVGELGNGTTPGSAPPVEVTGITNAVRVAKSASGACAALDDGRIACWGTAESGQLGTSFRDDVATPTPVPLTCMP